MTIEQMQKRLAELQELAKQHESVLLQISGAIQEYNRAIAEEQSKAMAKPEGNDDAANQVTQ
jgi:monomeric isocitrate dehydrogenase